MEVGLVGVDLGCYHFPSRGSVVHYKADGFTVDVAYYIVRSKSGISLLLRAAEYVEAHWRGVLSAIGGNAAASGCCCSAT